MPPPEPYTLVAYAVITIAPLLLLVAFLYMYRAIGRAGLVGKPTGRA